jgi:hypothetical protein
MSSPFFIVGCPRSGTTIMKNLLRAHPNLTIARESHFIPQYYKAYGDPATDKEAERLAARILDSRFIRELGVALTPADFRHCRSYRAVVSLLFDSYADTQGKSRWGEKTPQNVTEIPVLAEIFPGAQFIHIIRDGRDVAMSWLKLPYEPRNLYTAATMWRDRVSAGRRSGAALPQSQYLEVRFEHLLNDAPATMRSVCEFLGEPYDEAVLTPDPGPNRAEAQISHDHIVSGNHGKWKRSMKRRDLALFEGIASDLLSDLGYEVTGAARRVSGAEAALWKTHQFVAALLTRLWEARDLPRAKTYLRLQIARLAARRRSEEGAA